MFVALRYVTSLRYVTLRYFMLCYVMLCYFMVCHATLCYAMLCYVMLCYFMLGKVSLVIFTVMRNKCVGKSQHNECRCQDNVQQQWNKRETRQRKQLKRKLKQRC